VPLVRCTRCAPPAVHMGWFASRSRSQTISHPSHTYVSCVSCASHVRRSPAHHSQRGAFITRTMSLASHASPSFVCALYCASARLTLPSHVPASSVACPRPLRSRGSPRPRTVRRPHRAARPAGHVHAHTPVPCIPARPGPDGLPAWPSPVRPFGGAMLPPRGSPRHYAREPPMPPAPRTRAVSLRPPQSPPLPQDLQPLRCCGHLSSPSHPTAVPHR
jgi:hypothetical protein